MTLQQILLMVDSMDVIAMSSASSTLSRTRVAVNQRTRRTPASRSQEDLNHTLETEEAPRPEGTDRLLAAEANGHLDLVVSRPGDRLG